MGVGFAVPINIARFVTDKLVTEGKVSRGYLGIQTQPLTPDLAKLFHLPDESSGILVGGVTPDSAAQKAGVKDGDVVTEFNGKKVTNTRNFRLLVAQTSPGTKVTLKVLRGDDNNRTSEKVLTANLAEFPREYLTAGDQPNESKRRNQSKMDALDGVEVSDLDSRTKRQADIPSSVQGALVTNVDPNSNAAEAGLRPGDIITEINKHPVKSSDDAVTLSEKANSDHILLRVWSAGGGGGPGGTHYLSVDNTKRK
jgi:serine protease Do